MKLISIVIMLLVVVKAAAFILALEGTYDTYRNGGK